MKTSPLLYVACLCALSVALFLTGAATWADEPAESAGADKAQPSDDSTPSADSTPKNEAEEKEKEEADPYALPETDDPAKLAEFIETLQEMRPRTIEQYRDFMTKRPPAIIAAADKILAGDATDEQALVAVKAKMSALRQSRRDPTAAEKLQDFVAEMKKDKRADIANVALTFGLVATAGDWAKLDAQEKKSFFADVTKAFASDQLTGEHLSLAMDIGRSFEQSGNTEDAVEFFNEVGPLFKDSSVPQLARYGEKFEGMARRITLPDNEMEITGQLLDGSTFDWGAYKGKVVLVDFWATWCGPCVAELPNVLKEYERYHDKGFDVVGISLDSDKEKVEKFVQERNIPWAIIYSDDPNGWDAPMATYYGIMGIPTAILVNQEGKVVSMRARGEALGAELEKLLGKVESPAEPEKEAVDSEKPEETKSDS